MMDNDVIDDDDNRRRTTRDYISAPRLHLAKYCAAYSNHSSIFYIPWICVLMIPLWIISPGISLILVPWLQVSS
jgi:hypothetical protein